LRKHGRVTDACLLSRTRGGVGVLELEFEHPASRETLSVGPAAYFIVKGCRLLAGPGEQEVGFYEDGLWHVEGRSFTAARAAAPTRIDFHEDAGGSCAAPLGPFEHMKLVDGAIRCGPKLGKLLARLDEDSQQWLIYPSRKKCSAAVLSPAGKNGMARAS
jgi:hypothetical protein